MACVFAALVAAGSHLRVPIYGNPVPFTLQVVFVLMAGALLRPGVAAGSMVLFVLSGVSGAPVFAGGAAGSAYLLGPTGGYLFGFVIGAAVCSLVLRGRRDSMARIVLSMIAAVGTIYFFGVLQLGAYQGGDFVSALRFGVLPFLPGAGLKIVIAAAFVSSYSSLVSRD